MTPRLRFVLASASPARLATLRAAGVEPEVIVSGVDEEQVAESSPARTALVLARLKAAAVAGQLPATDLAPTVLVLGCDSVLELDGEAHGKPADAAEARQRWLRMRGRTGLLHTGHSLVEVGSGRTTSEVASTLVRFADVNDDEIDAYLATGEPLRVAGAFTVDGLGGPFVEGIEGDHHNVVGLSLPLLRRMLRSFGLDWTALWG
jgi:septum formation protein